MRILYLPIHNPSHRIKSLANVHGLRDALLAAGHEVREWDYCATEEVSFFSVFERHVEEFNPDILLSQFQGTNYMYPALALETKDRNRIWVNFNQDYWPEHLTAHDMLAMLKYVDLQLVANASVLPDYAAAGVNAAFWPSSFETSTGELPDVPAHDVVFLGNNYSAKRQVLYEILRSLPYNVGIYGSGWAQSEGDCNYDFAYAEALYKKAKIAISDNQFPEAVASVSNRLFQALAAGGAVVLQQWVAELRETTGITNLKHYVLWNEFVDLEARIKRILAQKNVGLNHIKNTDDIVRDGQVFVRQHHSYDVRVRELFAMVERVNEHV